MNEQQVQVGWKTLGQHLIVALRAMGLEEIKFPALMAGFPTMWMPDYGNNNFHTGMIFPFSARRGAHTFRGEFKAAGTFVAPAPEKVPLYILSVSEEPDDDAQILEEYSV